MLHEGNQIHNFISSSGSGTVINYGSGSDFLTNYGSSSGSGSTSQKVTVPTVPVRFHNTACQVFQTRIHFGLQIRIQLSNSAGKRSTKKTIKNLNGLQK